MILLEYFERRSISEEQKVAHQGPVIIHGMVDGNLKIMCTRILTLPLGNHELHLLEQCPGGGGSVGQNVLPSMLRNSQKRVFFQISLWSEQIWEKGVSFTHFAWKGYGFSISLFIVGGMLKMSISEVNFLKFSLGENPQTPHYLAFLASIQHECITTHHSKSLSNH